MPRHRKAKITSQSVDRLGPGDTVMDTVESGFGVRVQKGRPHYFVRKHAKGARHYQTIGEHGAGGLTVTLAREKASRVIRQIKDGLSPSQRRAADRAMPTVRELADIWLEVHVDAKLKPKSAAAYRSCLRTIILPAIGAVRVDQVDAPAVIRMHHGARTTPYAANRSLAVTSKLMSFAERQGYRPQNSNPAQGVERYREEKRDRFLSMEELAAIGAALASAEASSRHSPRAIGAIGLLLLTGMRLNEVLRLRWGEVDFARGLLLLTDSKTGAKPVILGAPAIKLLMAQPRVAGSPWVFPSIVDPCKPISDLKRAWHTVTRLSGLEDVRIHDLRHSFAAVAASSGGSLPMIGRLLGHRQAQTTARYAHLAYDPVRELADQTSQAIETALKPAIRSEDHGHETPNEKASC